RYLQNGRKRNRKKLEYCLHLFFWRHFFSVSPSFSVFICRDDDSKPTLMEDFYIKEISTEDPEYLQLLGFGNRILRQPLGLNLMDEDLSGEEKEFILVAMQGDEILGCVQLQPQEDKTIKLRQMAIAEKRQGKGLGKVLLMDAEEAAKEYGFEKIIL